MYGILAVLFVALISTFCLSNMHVALSASAERCVIGNGINYVKHQIVLQGSADD